MIDPRILVLDDALSAVDTYTEEEILTRLGRRDARSHVADRVAPRVDGAERRSDFRPGSRPNRRARHGTTISWQPAASTRRCIAGSCWKRSWQSASLSARAEAGADERGAHARGRRSLGKAYDARLMRRLLGRIWRPYRLQRGRRAARIIGASVLQLAQPYLMKIAIDRHIAIGNLDGLDRIALCVPRHPAGVLRARVRPDLGAADDRAAHHVRHAHADLRAPAAPRPAVLRPESRRPADDARHDRRRRPQRSLHRRRRVDLRRHLHAGRHHDRARS